ncbi:MAG TPA: alkaline phosphatase D family protein [Symbiobacteriaceae bacterium]|nr:alkaline phosphatase D family protein [Symbiobacteriaceae bacterium]
MSKTKPQTGAHVEQATWVTHGPMLGAVSDRSARIWLRTDRECTVRVLVAHSQTLNGATYSTPLLLEEAHDYTGVLLLPDLTPNSTYYYALELDGAVVTAGDTGAAVWSLRTAPPPATGDQFKVVFGSCAKAEWNGNGNGWSVWNAIAAQEPALIISMGDNPYLEDLDTLVKTGKYTPQELPGYIRQRYQVNRTVPEFRQLSARVPVYAAWDDNDYGRNDGDGASNPYKNIALQVFKEYWANPSYAPGGRAGTWTTFTYGGVQFFLLDDEFYADPQKQKTEPKSFLGGEQLAWLKEELLRSNAAFKVLVTGSPWNPWSYRPDAWYNYPAEFKELCTFLRDNAISGAFALSGDVHRTEAYRFSTGVPGLYDLAEFVSSPLKNAPKEYYDKDPGHTRQALWHYTEGPSFGVLEFDTRKENPTVTFRPYKDTGEPLEFSLTLTLDDLT